MVSITGEWLKMTVSYNGKQILITKLNIINSTRNCVQIPAKIKSRLRTYIVYYTSSYKRSLIQTTGPKPALGPNCVFIYGIIQFGSKAGLAQAVIQTWTCVVRITFYLTDM